MRGPEMIRRSISLLLIILMITTADSEPTLTGLFVWVALGVAGALFWLWAEHDDPSIWTVDDRTFRAWIIKNQKRKGKKNGY